VPDRFTISFDLSRESYLQAVRLLLDDAPEVTAAARRLRKKGLLTQWPTVPLICLLMFYMTRGEFAEPRLHILAAGLLGGAVGGLYMWYVASLPNYVKRVRTATIRAAAQTDASGFTGPTAITATDDQFTIRTRAGEAVLPWSSVGRVRTVPGYSLVQLAMGRAIIPDNAFKHSEKREEFLAEVRARVDLARLPSAERARRYLQGRDRPCPKCRYNHRDAAGEACPECGHRLSYEELTQ
jgi:hypothetical protein